MLMLHAADIPLTAAHLLIIFFNLFGWMWPKARRLHFYSIVATALSWFGLGIWFGMGYCPITNWQWRVKEQLGEYDLPNSFIKYFADSLSGRQFDAELVDLLTAVGFIMAAVISIYYNFIRRSKQSL